MEGKSSLGYSSSSSSSFATDLFGSKDASVLKPSGIFDSIFGLPSSQVIGRESKRSEKTEQDGKITGKLGSDDSNTSEGKSHVPLNEDGTSLYGERGPPCHYSSSIYYGGQDIFSNPKNNQTPSVYSTFRNKEGEDDSDSASRGNWWQGSLYY